MDGAGLGGVLDPVGTVVVGDTTLIGGSNPTGSTQPIGVGVLAPTTPQGSVATVGVASGGELVTVGVGQGGPGAGPLESVTGLLDPLANVTVGSTTVVGSDGGAAPLGVSVLSPDPASGQSVAVGVLSNGQLLDVGGAVTGPEGLGGGPVGDLLGATVGETSLLGENPAIDASVLSPTSANGSVVSVDVLSNGQPLGVTVNAPAGSEAGLGGVVGAVTAPLTSSSGPVAGPVGDLLGTTVGETSLLGQNPAIDASILSPTSANGGAVSVDVLSNGQPLGVSVNAPDNAGAGLGGMVGAVTAPLAGATSGGTGGAGSVLAPVTGALGGVTAPVTGLLGGLRGN